MGDKTTKTDAARDDATAKLETATETSETSTGEKAAPSGDDDMTGLAAVLLETPEFMKKIMATVYQLLAAETNAAPHAILTSPAFVEGVETIVAGYLAQHAPEPAEVVESAEAKIAAGQAELVAQREAAAAKAAEQQKKAARDAAKVRQANEAKARDAYAAAIVDKPVAIDLTTVKASMLSIHDSATFSIDFSCPVDGGNLTMDDQGMVRLRHTAINIGEDMAEPFTMKGVALHLLIDGGATVLWCPLTQPMVVGGGHKAQLSADSLVFRPQR